jgi:arylsulfatase A-like enzyme
VLFDALERRGVLENTVLIVTADHGEQFGEHGDYGHGCSVYQPEIHVPLLIRFPRGVPEGRVVREAVSLRDLPATVLELAGLEGHSVFPGRSLSASWGEVLPVGPRRAAPPFSELAAPIETAIAKPASPETSGSVQAVVVEKYVYIRRGGGAEELYDLRTDPGEQSNRIDSANPELVERCRKAFDGRFGDSSTSPKPARLAAEPLTARSSAD